jgi:hypothetical protein
MEERMRWILLALVVALAGCRPSTQELSAQRRITEEANAEALRRIEAYRQAEAELTPELHSYFASRPPGRRLAKHLSRHQRGQQQGKDSMLVAGLSTALQKALPATRRCLDALQPHPTRGVMAGLSALRTAKNCEVRSNSISSAIGALRFQSIPCPEPHMRLQAEKIVAFRLLCQTQKAITDGQPC